MCIATKLDNTMFQTLSNAKIFQTKNTETDKYSVQTTSSTVREFSSTQENSVAFKRVQSHSREFRSENHELSNIKDLVQQDGKLLQICVIKRLQRTWWRNLLAANCPKGAMYKSSTSKKIIS